MIILSKKNICFIHIPKTAGTSFTKTFLFPYLEPQYGGERPIAGLETPKRYYHYPYKESQSVRTIGPRVVHVSYQTLLDYLPKNSIEKQIIEQCTKVAIVRHPLDRLISAWKMYGYRHFNTPQDFLLNDDKFLPFSQYSYIKGANPLFLIKYENLEEDSKRFCNKFNFKYKPLRKDNVTKDRPEVGRDLNLEEINYFKKFILNNCKEDLDNFNYKL